MILPNAKVVSEATTVPSYGEVHQGSMAAIEAEIASVEADLKAWGADQPIRARSGTDLGNDGDQFFYRFEIERPVRVPEYSAVEIVIETSLARGHVSSLEDEGRAVVCAMEEPLRAPLDAAILSFDATYVLRQLQGTLGQLFEPDEVRYPAILRLLGLMPSSVGRAVPSHPSITRRQLNGEQVSAISTALASDLTLVFGPPGTGKTRTLGCLAAEMAEKRNMRILITAHTNTALDTALASVCDALDTSLVEDGMVVRPGKLTRHYEYLTIGLAEAARRQHRSVKEDIAGEIAAIEALAGLLLPHAGEEEAPSLLTTLGRRHARKGRKKSAKEDLYQKAVRLHKALLAGKFNGQAGPAYNEALQRAEALRERLADESGETIRNARIVGATLSKIAIDPESLGNFDAVLVDEASMSALPYVIVAASRTQSKLIVLGDPMQLKPVVQSRSAAATRYLKRNPFTHLGLEDPANDDPRRPILTTQYRMSPKIRELVSDLFYAGRLHDAPAVAERSAPTEVVLIDTSNWSMGQPDELGEISLLTCTSEKSGRSRVNLAHIEIVVALAKALSGAGETDNAIITPFAPQQKQLRERLWDDAHGFMRMGAMIGTIHRSQGGEWNNVIIDTVDTPPNMSQFLDDRWNDDIASLLCVGLSRARNRLIILAHAEGFRAKYGKRGRLIVEVLIKAYRTGAYVRAEGLAPDEIANLAVGGQQNIFYTGASR